MDKKLFEKIVEELLKEAVSPTLIFALQNEPLLDDRIFDLIRYLKSKRRDIYCILPTNGELLDRFEQGMISASGLDQLTISLNAHLRETYEQINNGIDFERVTGNIRSIVANPSLKPMVEIRFALNEKNAPEIPEALEHWKKQGIHTKVVGITNRGGALRTYERFKIINSPHIGPQILRSWKHLMAALRNIAGCELPFFQMDILFNGDVITCCHDWNRSPIIGNVNAQSLKSVWNSEKINEIRKNIIQKNYLRISSCRECSMVRFPKR